MRFAQAARVVLLRPIRQRGELIEPAGAQGVVERERGSVAIVRFTASGRTIPVKSEKLGVIGAIVGPTNLRGTG